MPVTEKSMAPALSRGLRVLELLARSESPQSLTTIAKSLGIAMSSAHSLCMTLKNEGYVDRQSDGTFDLSLRVLELASAKIGRYDIVEHFYTICDEIPVIRENAAVITVMDGPDVLYIGSRASPHPLGVSFRVGMKLPAYSVASGRAILSTMSDSQIMSLFPEDDLAPLTTTSITSRAELLDMLAEARKTGYATERGGAWPHMYAYGAPVNGVGRKTGVAVMLYPADVTPAMEQDAISAIRNLASRLEQYSEILP